MTNLHVHDTNRCRKILAQMNAYADDELAADLCRDLERHLEQCPDCRIVLDTLSRTIKLYHALHETPAALPANVEARLLDLLKS